MSVNRKTLKNRAKSSLQGKYWIAFLVCLILSLLSSSGSVASGISTATNSFMAGGYYNQMNFSVNFNPLSLLGLFLGGTLSVGAAQFFLNLANQKEAKIEDLFSHFKHWVNTFVMQLLITVFTILWTLLFIIPGIIASLSYFATPYILAEHPEIKAKDAIKMSKEMMKGHKKELFVLQLSFIGWFILGICALGIGLFFVIPYYQATSAEFFNEISGNNYEKTLNGEAV